VLPLLRLCLRSSSLLHSSLPRLSLLSSSPFHHTFFFLLPVFTASPSPFFFPSSPPALSHQRFQTQQWARDRVAVPTTNHSSSPTPMPPASSSLLPFVTFDIIGGRRISPSCACKQVHSSPTLHAGSTFARRQHLNPKPL